MKVCGSQLFGKVQFGFFLILYFYSIGHVVNGQTVRLDSAEVSNDLTTLTLTICFTDAQSGSGSLLVAADPKVFDFSSQLGQNHILSISNDQQCGTYMISVTNLPPWIGMSTTITIASIAGNLLVSANEGNNSKTVFIPGVFFDPFRYTISEGSSSNSLFICRLPITASVITTLMSIDVTAVAVSDYTAVVGQTVLIPSGSRCAFTSININDDDIIEDNETFTISVSVSEQSSLMVSSSQGTATVTIMDDDEGVFFNPVLYTTSEGSSLAFLAICRLPTTASLSTTLMSTDGMAEAGSDYNAVTETVEVQSGSRCATISIEIIDDDITEDTESFTVSVSVSEQSPLMVSPSQGTATVTILDDDPGVFFDSVSYSTSEDDDVASLSICRLPISAFLLTTLMSTDVTAVAVSDYTAVSQTVLIQSGSRCASISIPIVDDNIIEGTESFTVSVSEQSSFMVSPSQGTATVTIMDNDPETLVVTLGSPTYSPSQLTSGQINTLSFDLPVTSVGAGISGTNLWMVEVFLSSSIGQGSSLLTATATLPDAAMNQGIDPGMMSTLSNLQVNLDLTNLSCDQFSFICVSLIRNQDANPFFILENNEGGTSVLQCKAITCQVSPCMNDPCGNGGTCSVVSNNFQCSCADGFFGETCQNILALNCSSDQRIVTAVGRDTALIDLREEITCSSDDLSCRRNGMPIIDLAPFYADVGEMVVSCDCGTSLGQQQMPLTCSFTLTVIANPCNPNPCDANATCTPDGENSSCTCNRGFTGDGKKIMDNGTGCTSCDRTIGVDWMYGQNCSSPCTCASDANCSIDNGKCSGACDEFEPTVCDKNGLNVAIAGSNVTVNENELFALMCTVNLGPNDVTVKWEYPADNTIPPVISKEGLTSTLTITNAMPSDSGQYTCIGTLEEPTNNVSSRVDSVFVNVKVQGEINDGFAVMKKASVGENVNLTCEAFGNPKPNVEWFLENGINFSNNVMQLDEEINYSPCCDVTRKLQFTQLTNENNGTYTCNVTVNGQLTDSENVDLFVIDFPEIAKLEIVQRAATSLMLTWQVTDYGQDDGVECRATYTETNEDNGMYSTNCEEKSCEIQNLTPDTEYNISVVCRNDAGPSNTETETARTIRSTPEEVPELRPTDGTDSVNSTSIVVTLPDEISDENGQIRCYELVVAVDRSSEDPDDDYPFDDVLDKSGGDESAYRAVVMNRSTFAQTKRVVIGMNSSEVTTCELIDPTRTRKRRSLIPPQRLTATNDPLESEKNYYVFLRVYVQSGEYYDYESSNYMEFETTKEPAPPPKGGPGAVTAVLVTLLIIIILLVVVVLFIYWKRRANNEHSGSNGEIMALQENGINGHKQDKVGQDNPAFEIEKVEPINIDELGNRILEKHQNNSRIFNAEFRSLLDVNRDATFEAFSESANAEKNRYINIYCYDHCRVRLEEIEGLDHSDYINANYINGYNVSDKFIASQGPKQETLEDHWRMLWEQKTATVIMLTRCFEDGGREKCAQYWPDKGSHTFGDFTVHLDSVAECPDYVIRKFRVTKEGEEEGAYHTITQFHYLAWPDHGVPEYPYKMLAFVKRIRQMTPPKPEKGNIVIHCSAGVGRTGTYITIDAMLDRLKEEKTVDIYNFIQSMRLNRRLLVQTVVQYIFIYHALHEEHLYGHTEIDLAGLHHYFRRLRMKTHSEDNSPLHNEFKTAATLPIKDTNSSEASVPANVEKNRTRNYLPYDRNRVKLERLVGDENSTYINASYINGYERKNMYITTQAPMENTTHDFWRMVWESLTSTIVMLTDLEEKGNEMCVKFWPEEEARTFGNLTVELTSESEEEDYTTMEFTMSNTEGVATRQVKMYRFHGWPEIGAPKCCEAACELVNIAHEHQRKAEREESAEQSKHPIIVFCHTGVGRTAVWVALSILMERARAEGVVDVFQTVRTLRQQRQHMIQDATQYEFLYEAVLRHLDTLDQYANFR